MDEFSIEEARPKLGEIVDRARLAGQSAVITRNGKAAAVLLPADGAVLRNVKVRHGIVEISGSLLMYGDSELIECDIRVPRPVTIRVGPDAAFENNAGDGIRHVERTPGA